MFGSHLHLWLFLWLGGSRFGNAPHVLLDFCEDLIEILHLLIFHSVELWRQAMREQVQQTAHGGERGREPLHVWVSWWRASLCAWASSACLPLERHSSASSLFAYSLPCYLKKDDNETRRFKFPYHATPVFMPAHNSSTGTGASDNVKKDASDCAKNLRSNFTTLPLTANKNQPFQSCGCK